MSGWQVLSIDGANPYADYDADAIDVKITTTSGLPDQTRAMLDYLDIGMLRIFMEQRREWEALPLWRKVALRVHWGIKARRWFR